MRLLKIVLSLVMTGALIWVAAYIINTSMTEAASRELAQMVRGVREAEVSNAAVRASAAEKRVATKEVQSEAAVQVLEDDKQKQTESLDGDLTVWKPEAEENVIQPLAADAGTDAAEIKNSTHASESAHTVYDDEQADAAQNDAHDEDNEADVDEHIPDDQLTETDKAEDPLLLMYGELARQNPDLIGWIRIQNTRIDYPVMHTPEEPEYYLHRDFEKNYAFEGIPFADGRCDILAPSDNIIIYGHNMRNGGMFAALRSYMDKTFFEEHPVITFDTLHARGEYAVFAAMQMTIGGLTAERMRCYSTSLTTDEQQIAELDAYLQKYAAIYDVTRLPGVGARVITLSTCTGSRSDRRMVVMAVHVDDIHLDIGEMLDK